MWRTSSASPRTGRTWTAPGPNPGTPRGPTTTSPSRSRGSDPRKYFLVLAIINWVYISSVSNATKFCFCLRSKDVNSNETGDNVNYVESAISCFMRYSDLRDDNICKTILILLFSSKINFLYLFKSRITRFLTPLGTRWLINVQKSLICSTTYSWAQ